MDPIKQATDALYEATKAKVLQDMKDAKRTNRRKAFLNEEGIIQRSIQGVDAFMVDTFIVDDKAPVLPLENMMEIYREWYENEGRHHTDAYSRAPPPPCAYTYIRDHHWVSRTDSYDFTGLLLKSKLTFEVPIPAVDFTTPTQQVEIKSRPKGRPKKASNLLEHMP